MELDVTTPQAFNVRAVPTNTVTISTASSAVILVPVPGGQGQAGPPGEGFQVFGETPAGAIDGSNTVFITANNYRATRTAVYLNGLRELHYTETSPNIITFDDPPWSGDNISVDYIVQ